MPTSLELLLGRRAAQVHLAVRPGVVARHLGQLLLALAALAVLPALGALALGDLAGAGRLAIVAAVLTAAGAAGARLPAEAHLQQNEALVVCAAVFCVAAAAFTWPIAGYGLDWSDALFESISGITTTGLTVLPSADAAPPSLLLLRGWMQWAGGLGVVVLALAFVVAPGGSSRELGFQQHEVEDLAGGTRAHARRTGVAYAGLTALGIGIVVALGVSPFDAVVHVFAAVSTGGFSSHDASLAAFDPAVRAALSALSIAGGVPFAWYYLAWWGRGRRILEDAQLPGLALAMAGVALLLWLLPPAPGGVPLGPGDAAVTAISAQTTTGFSSIAVSGLGAAAKLVLVASMFVGAGLGSTGGGVKIFRFLVALKLLGRSVQKASVPPSALLEERPGTARLGEPERDAALAIVLAHGGLIGLSWVGLLVAGHAPLDGLVEVTSAASTVGLSTGITGPGLDALSKGILSLDMLMGRVEILALVLLLFPATWIGRRRTD